MTKEVNEIMREIECSERIAQDIYNVSVELNDNTNYSYCYNVYRVSQDIDNQNYKYCEEIYMVSKELNNINDYKYCEKIYKIADELGISDYDYINEFYELYTDYGVEEGNTIICIMGELDVGQEEAKDIYTTLTMTTSCDSYEDAQLITRIRNQYDKNYSFCEIVIEVLKEYTGEESDAVEITELIWRHKLDMEEAVLYYYEMLEYGIKDYYEYEELKQIEYQNELDDIEQAIKIKKIMNSQNLTVEESVKYYNKEEENN